MSKKEHYERMTTLHLQSFQQWMDDADTSPDNFSRARREAYAQEALADLAKVMDKADREGITLSVDLDKMPVTRVKLKEEIALLQRRLEVEMASADSLSKEVADLRAEVSRVNEACAEIDNDAEAHAVRMERVALISAAVTFVLGVACGVLM